MPARPNSKRSAPPIDSPDRRRLPPLLRRAWYGLNQAFRRRIAHTKATPDQFTALRCLTEADPKGITQGELTQMMSSDPNTIASLVERMEAAGWIERLAHEKDRRAYRIRVKPAGRLLYKQLRQLAIELQASVLTVLPDGEREAFLTQLAAVAIACRDAAEKSPKRGK
ncbi:MAG: MarR family transcriptional regulator [Verrucomicrobia bacterium]|nr:MarR family transcriptional regulator [Verrucomicrobiota bacterium]